MNLKDFDLNLLVALDALLEEQHVTRAAKRVGLSQPAMSNALSRLRAELDDPLLVRTGSGMTPTPRALELIEPVKRALGLIESALSSDPFDPGAATATLHLTLSPGARHGMTGDLIETSRAHAPGIAITIGALEALNDPEDALRHGDTDLILATKDAISMSPSIEREALAERRSFALVSQDHPLASSKSTTTGALESFEQLAYGQQESLPDLLTATSLLSRTTSWLPLEEATATRLGTFADLTSIPIEGSAQTIAMYWHQRTDLDATHRWMREVIRGIFAKSREG